MQSSMQARLSPLLLSLPGLALCAGLAAAAMWLATYAGSGVLWALVAGMAIASFWTPSATFLPGIVLAGKNVLRLGVALLGFQISARTLHVLDGITIAALVVNVLIILAAGYLLGPLFGIDRDLSLVLAASVAICGASAAAAFALAARREPISARDLGCTIGIVSILSLAAMILYPLFAQALHLTPNQAGVLFGGSIHEVVHAVGAGYSVDAATGDVATVTKLLRVALLAPALMLVVAARGGTSPSAAIARPPLFLVGFVAFAALNIAGFVPPAIVDVATWTSRFFLPMAMCAIGLMLPWRSVLSYGWRPVVLLVVLSTILLALMTAVVCRFPQ